MKFKIHALRSDRGLSVEDTFLIEGGTVEEVQEKANDLLRQRGLLDADVWSEEIR